MIPIPIVWTNYSAAVRGRVLKFVSCERCSTEYVYALEREGEGLGTSFYFMNEGGASDHAMSAAEDSLQQYLQNDFDPVPCPVCGHYQRFMFSKLYDGGPWWVLIAKLLAVAAACLSGVGAAYWAFDSLLQPAEFAFSRLAVTSVLFAVFCLISFGLGAVERGHSRRYDPNTEDQQVRIEKGRSRAVTRAEFEAQQQGGHEATGHRNVTDAV